MKKFCQGGILSEYNFVIIYNKKTYYIFIYLEFYFSIFVVFSSDITKKKNLSLSYYYNFNWYIITHIDTIYNHMVLIRVF